jgi:hypothetical protein
MGNLDEFVDLLGCQLAASLHRKLGRTVQAGQTYSYMNGACGSMSPQSAVSVRTREACGFSEHCGYGTTVRSYNELVSLRSSLLVVAKSYSSILIRPNNLRKLA